MAPDKGVQFPFTVVYFILVAFLCRLAAGVPQLNGVTQQGTSAIC